MTNQPIINGKVVERSYEEYREDGYLVNRRYQRKLVWGLDEKRAFINSLANGYPVPLFLFCANEYRGVTRKEIIDGMQRLNAIFSFIENEFCLEDGRYFDLSSTATTKNLLDNGRLVQKMPLLDREICVKIVSYELPYSVYSQSNPDIIDEVFRRINANGKHLSRQEIRQAGATGEFAQLVRNLSTQLRGDVSHDDVLLLSRMKEISIGRDNDEWGINPDQVFWVKENIINKEDLRQSLDEELIADLLAAMVITPIPPSNVSVLDEYYGFSSDDPDVRAQKVEEAILAATPERIMAQFLHVYDEIRNIFYNRPKTIVGQITNAKVYRGPRYFQILFLSLFDLLIIQEKKIEDYDRLYGLLDGIGTRTMNIASGGGWWPSKDKSELVSSTAAVLSPCFVARNGHDPMYRSYVTEIETLLKQSRTENSQYDFKQGLHDIITGQKNEQLLSKIIKQLTAMGNSEKCAVGYIVLGVADKFEDAQKIKNKYRRDYYKVGSFYITGIDGEVIEYYRGDYDAYFAMVKDAISKAPIPEHYRRQLGSSIRLANYYNNSVIIFRIRNDNGAILFDNSYFTRNAASIDPTPVSAEEMPTFFLKFV